MKFRLPVLGELPLSRCGLSTSPQHPTLHHPESPSQLDLTMPPGLAHAAIAALLTALIGVPAHLLGGSAWVGAALAIGFYVGRERRQSEEWAGSNRIPPWVWKPRAFRDAGWPAVSATVVALAISKGFSA